MRPLGARAPPLPAGPPRAARPPAIAAAARPCCWPRHRSADTERAGALISAAFVSGQYQYFAEAPTCKMKYLPTPGQQAGVWPRGDRPRQCHIMGHRYVPQIPEPKQPSTGCHRHPGPLGAGRAAGAGLVLLPLLYAVLHWPGTAGTSTALWNNSGSEVWPWRQPHTGSSPVSPSSSTGTKGRSVASRSGTQPLRSRPTTTCEPLARCWPWQYDRCSRGSTYGYKAKAPSKMRTAHLAPCWRSLATTCPSTSPAPSLWKRFAKWPSMWTKRHSDVSQSSRSHTSRRNPSPGLEAVYTSRDQYDEAAQPKEISQLQSHVRLGRRLVRPLWVDTDKPALECSALPPAQVVTVFHSQQALATGRVLPRSLLVLVVTLAKRRERASSRSPRRRREAGNSRESGERNQRPRSRARKRSKDEHDDEAPQDQEPIDRAPSEAAATPAIPAHVHVCVPQLSLGWLRARAQPQGITVRALLQGIVQQRFPELQLSELGLYPFILPPPGFFDGATGPAAHLQLHHDLLVYPSHHQRYAAWVGNPAQSRMRPGALESLRASMQPFVPPSLGGPCAAAPAGEVVGPDATILGVTAKAKCRPPLSLEQAWLRSPLSDQQRSGRAPVSPTTFAAHVAMAHSLPPVVKASATEGQRDQDPSARPLASAEASSFSQSPLVAKASASEGQREPVQSARPLTGEEATTPVQPQFRDGSQTRPQRPAPVGRSPSPEAGTKSARGKTAHWDLSNVDPPTCATCKEKVWPVVRARSTKFHCKGCQDGKTVSGVSTPVCALCSSPSWDGIWRGRRFLEKGTAFVCAPCWIIDAGTPQEVERWHDWFSRKATKYPDIFSQPPALGWCLDPT